MCFSKTPKIPDVPAPNIPRKPPTRVDDSVLQARGAQKRIESLRRGVIGTRISGPGGFTLPAQTASKTLLGQ